MKFSNKEEYDVIIVYGACEENATRAILLYAVKYSSWNQSSRSTFLRLNKMLLNLAASMYRNANVVKLQQTKNILLLF